MNSPRSILRSTGALATLALAALSNCAAAEIKLPAILSDHMVLQRESEVALWGSAAPGAKVEIHGDFLAQPLTCTADAKGAFKTRVHTLVAGGPHTLELRENGAGAASTISDIWFGEIWLCGGQSNMEMPIAPVDGYAGVRDWKKELESADLPQLRYFDVINTATAGPAQDCAGKWVASTRESAQHFSATGFFFAREIQRELHVPVGLVGVNWGGTPAQAWTSAEGLARFPAYKQDLDLLATVQRDPAGAEHKVKAELAAWFAQLGDARDSQGSDHGQAAPASAASSVPAGWKSMEQPGRWSGELANFDGVLFLARRFTIPAEWAGKELVVELGAIDDMDTTWLDGERIGGMEETGAWGTPRSYRVPARLVKAGEHELSIRVLDTGGYGGLSGKPAELRFFPAGEASAARPLAGTWGYRVGKKLEELPPFPNTAAVGQYTASALFNGMIAPILPFGIRGALFYQGESNRYDARGYASLLQAMIRDWRAHFGQGDFPFYMVQIAPFGYGDSIGASGFLRDAQRATAEALPNCGMAVTMDIGDAGDIHPSNKQDVGHRLALLALARTYGRKELECCGPTFAKATVGGGAIRVSFTHAAGLVARGGEPAQFSIAGKDGRFEPAKATIVGEEVVLLSVKVPQPLFVRYAWCEACETNLFNAAGLPAVPFRTDSF
jgi:sialate O-acetylesterase